MSCREYCYVKTRTLEAKKIYAQRICADQLCLRDPSNFVGATGPTGATGPAGPSGSLELNVLNLLCTPDSTPPFGATQTVTLGYPIVQQTGSLIQLDSSGGITFSLLGPNSLYLFTLQLDVDVSNTESAGYIIINLTIQGTASSPITVIQDQITFLGPSSVQSNSAMQCYVSGSDVPYTGTVQISSGFVPGSDPVIFHVTLGNLVISRIAAG